MKSEVDRAGAAGSLTPSLSIIKRDVTAPSLRRPNHKFLLSNKIDDKPYRRGSAPGARYPPLIKRFFNVVPLSYTRLLPTKFAQARVLFALSRDRSLSLIIDENADT